MNKKTISLLSLGAAFVAIAYVIYNSLNQLKDIEYDLFTTDEEEEND